MAAAAAGGQDREGHPSGNPDETPPSSRRETDALSRRDTPGLLATSRNHAGGRGARLASERVRGRDGPPTTTRRARRNAGDTHGIFPEPPTGGVGRPGAGGERDHANGVGGRPNGGRPGERRRGRGAVKLGPRA